jgi:hypothetical protein
METEHGRVKIRRQVTVRLSPGRQSRGTGRDAVQMDGTDSCRRSRCRQGGKCPVQNHLSGCEGRNQCRGGQFPARQENGAEDDHGHAGDHYRYRRQLPATEEVRSGSQG